MSSAPSGSFRLNAPSLQPQSVGLLKAYSHSRRIRLFLRPPQLARREVHPGHAISAACQLDGMTAGAAPDIENGNRPVKLELSLDEIALPDVP